MEGAHVVRLPGIWALAGGTAEMLLAQGQGLSCTLMTSVLASAQSMAAGRSDRG